VFIIFAMRSYPPTTVNEMKTIIRRHWRAGLAAMAGLLVVVVATVPWHGSTTLQPAADGARPTASATASHPTSPHAPTPNAKAAPAKKAPAKAPASHVVKVDGPVSLRVPGQIHLPWPSMGQAGITVSGIGAMGRSGSAKAVPTASVAKAMTAYLILKDHPIKGNGPWLRVSPAEAALFPTQVRMGQSLVPVRPNEVLSERQALQALMLASADNMAQILARWDAGSVPAFVAKMNTAAKQLGMASTHYTDPSGYEKHTVSTVGDQMKLASTALRVPGFKQVTSQKTAFIPVAGHIKNFNQLLAEPGVMGIKTGSMSAAGGCLAFAAQTKVAGRYVTILGTVLGQRSNRIGDLRQAFASSHNLLGAAKRSLTAVRIVHKGQVVSKVPGTARTLVASNDVVIPGWAGMSVAGKVTASVAPAAKSGATVGTLTVGSYGKTAVAVH
jgi:serine-type D-Ala-D-Ala carboxypeptidase (penicillin-binding protein 5/6)